MVAKVSKVARYRDNQTGMVERVAKVARYRDRGTGKQTDRQVLFRGLQRLRGTERDIETDMVAGVANVARYRDIYTDRYGCNDCKGCKVQRQIDRKVWLQGLQRLRGTKKDIQTGMVARVAKVARYRDR